MIQLRKNQFKITLKIPIQISQLEAMPLMLLVEILITIIQHQIQMSNSSDSQRNRSFFSNKIYQLFL